MPMDEKKRQRISLLGSLGFHIVAALIIGLTGLLSFTSLEQSDIFEVTAVSDSSAGDSGDSGAAGGSSGGESSSQEQPQPVANSQQQAFTPEQIGSDAILEHSDTSPTKVTYDQLEQLQKVVPTDEGDKQAPVIAPRPALAVKANLNSNGNGNSTGNNNSSANSENGNGNTDGNGNGDKGNSNGNGNGNGGNGNGNGNGGNGSDLGGEATNEIVNNPAQPPIPTRRAQPRYPSSARDAGIEGTVRIRFLIGKDGSVESASVAASSGNGELDQAALEAAYKWRFTPAKDNFGRPVRCYANGPITFSLR